MPNVITYINQRFPVKNAGFNLSNSRMTILYAKTGLQLKCARAGGPKQAGPGDSGLAAGRQGH